MTVKELADVAGVSVETIRRTGNRLYPGISRKGVTTQYTEDQAKIIIQEVRKRNMVSETLPPQNVEVLPQNVVVDLLKTQQMFMEKILDRLDRLERNSPLQLTAPKEDYFSLVAYTSLNNIQVNRSELALHGRTLKSMAVEKGMEIRTIPDERWGKVNSYPVELLDEYFSV